MCQWLSNRILLKQSHSYEGCLTFQPDYRQAMSLKWGLSDFPIGFSPCNVTQMRVECFPIGLLPSNVTQMGFEWLYKRIFAKQCHSNEGSMTFQSDFRQAMSLKWGLSDFPNGFPLSNVTHMRFEWLSHRIFVRQCHSNEGWVTFQPDFCPALSPNWGFEWLSHRIFILQCHSNEVWVTFQLDFHKAKSLKRGFCDFPIGFPLSNVTHMRFEWLSSRIFAL